MPQLHVKEMIMGFIASRNMMLYPLIPEIVQDAKIKPTDIGLLEARGYRPTAGGFREGIAATLKRLQIHALIFFALHLSDAYIGRLFSYLSTLLSMKYTQLTAPLISHLIDIAGIPLF